jgi:flagellar hook assembly protein FlgD
VAPNPTRAACSIQYVVAQSGPVRLEVLDVSGRLVATLANQVQDSGRYSLTWDGTESGALVPSGLLFVRFTAPGQTTVKKLAVVR